MAAEIKYPVITLGREYCAYGRTVAAALSEHFAIPFYDRDFVVKTALKSGYTEEEIQAEGEKINQMSILMNSFLGTSYVSSYDAIFEAQKRVILDLVKEPCILVGRCADHILKEHKIDAFNIFLYSDMEHKVKRAAELPENANETNLRKLVEKTDNLRATYYKHYTGENIRDYKNYHICLDTGKIGVDKSIEFLKELLTK